MGIIEKASSDKGLSTSTSRLLSMLCLAATLLIFWMPTYYIGKRFLGLDVSKIPLIQYLPFTTKPIHLLPGLRSGIIGLLLIAPLYIRKVLHWEQNSIYTMISFILNLSLASTIAVICFEDLSDSLFDAIWPIQDVRILLLMFAVALTWLGMRAIAGIAYILLFLLVMLNLSMANTAMGFNGFLCVLLGTLGLILQNGLTPRQMFSEFVDAFRKPASDIKATIAEAGTRMDDRKKHQ